MSSVIQGYFPHGLRGNVQRMGTRTVAAAPIQLTHMAQAAGQPLPPHVLQRMERAFGTSFADVRVHVGAEAAAIGAVAYTRGTHIHFAPGQYNPATAHGQRVLGHELAHVVQQRTGRVQAAAGHAVAIVHDAVLEAEAERATLRIATTAAAPPRMDMPARTVPVAQPFLGALYNYFWGGGNQAPVQAPVVHVPTPQEIREQNRQNFRRTGQPGRIDPAFYDTVHQQTWNRITHFDGRAKNRKRYTSHHIVRTLFQNFIGAGFRYHLMTTGAHAIITKGPDGEASCLGLAKAFADVLHTYGIDAEARYVRGPNDGRFLVHVPNFIDPNVIGHIYDGGQLLRGYYCFSSHAATWVPSENCYYDPMAKTTYASFDPLIICELNSTNNDIEYIPKTYPATPRHSSGKRWKLVRTEQEVAGGFMRLKMVKRT